MVSAPPSTRRKRKAEAAAARRAALRALPWYRRPLLLALAVIGTLLLALAAVRGAQQWLADPLARGREAYATGDYRSARVDLTAAIAERETPAARIDLARALIALGRGEEAARQIERALAIGAAEQATTVLRAETRLLAGDADGALAVLRQPLTASDAADAARIAALAHWRAGRLASADLAFTRAIRDGASVRGWIDFARYRLAEQDLVGADNAIAEALALAPDHLGAGTLKAEIVRTRGGPVASLPWYEAVLGDDPRHIPALLGYAAALGESGRHAAMVDALTTVEGIEPRNPDLLFLQASVAARGGEPALARTLIGRIAGPVRDRPDVLLLKSAVELSLDAPVLAGQTAARLVAMQPDNRRARRLLALALARADDLRGAVLVIDPITTAPDADSWSLMLLSDAFSGMGWREDARQPLDRASRLAPGAPAVLAGTEGGDSLDPGVAIPAIRARIAAGRGDEALGLAIRLADANPGVAQARLLAGDAALAAGDASAAIRHFREAANIRFDEAVMLRLVSTLSAVGDRAGAAEALGAYMARWPENLPAMRVAAVMAAESGEWDRANAILAAAIARAGPDDALLLMQAARAAIETGDVDAAVPLARRAYRLLPGNASASGIYGLALMRSGADGPDARDLLIKAVQLAPEDMMLREWLAESGRR